MNCPNCGTSNLENATICVNCGRALTATPQPPSQSYTPPPPPQPAFTTAPPPAPAPPGGTAPVIYLILSILMLLCCCNPVALVPLVFSIIAISKRSAGDYAAAEENAGRTALWFWISVAALVILYVIFFAFFGGLAFLEGLREGLHS